uniref:Protein kinase domain-containing protein n=1 Tax=Pyramimonas obovata TaxID=1411642 RepID=A0A7S0QX17_9CHLO|mmetsp:Transcript_15207/g.32768  ORF Transcript_15207/g.32768 Transcript_15207/m.32768 type:complete len:395 (+) Transcript_15207:125-1309(+)
MLSIIQYGLQTSCARASSAAHAFGGRRQGAKSQSTWFPTNPNHCLPNVGLTQARTNSNSQSSARHAPVGRKGGQIKAGAASSRSPTPIRSDEARTKRKDSFSSGSRRKKLTDFYELGEEIGKGGFGVVRLATDKETGKEFACKIINVTEKNRDLIFDEVCVLTKLRNSRHVARLQDVFYSSEHLFIVTELCTGRDVLEAIRNLPEDADPQYKEQMVAHFIRSAMCALLECHDLNICHRDIKPQNFLLAFKGAGAPIKMVDFGFSTIYDRRKKNTKHGLKGTPHFVPPEAFNGVCTPAGDMWSLGVMAYLLLTSKNPFEDPSLCEELEARPHDDPVCMDGLMKSILKGDLDTSSPEWENISCAARHFVLALLQLDPQKRPTAKEAMRHAWLCPYR